MIGNWAVSFADSLFIYPGISVPWTEVRTKKIWWIWNLDHYLHRGMFLCFASFFTGFSIGCVGKQCIYDFQHKKFPFQKKWRFKFVCN